MLQDNPFESPETIIPFLVDILDSTGLGLIFSAGLIAIVVMGLVLLFIDKATGSQP